MWLQKIRARLPHLVLWGVPMTFLLALVIFQGEHRTLVMRWLFFFGFIFQFWVGAWVVITVTRMKHEQAITITMLKMIGSRNELKSAIDQWTDREAEPPK